MRSSILLFAVYLAQAASPPRFLEHTVATGFKGGYQVVVADMNRDGKPDLIALASGMAELVWYENPGWQRHVIVGSQSRMINLAARDADGDGIPEIVLASQFAMQPKDSVGLISVLKPGPEPNLPWSANEIDRLTTSHRMRWADIEGNGKPVVVNAPLAAAGAEPPDYRGHTPLVYYRPGDWIRQTISEENAGVVHGIYVMDWDGDGRDEILTAGFAGIHLFKLGKDGNWNRTRIAAGDPAPWPKSGSSDVAVGQSARRRFVAAIEPWHGNKVVIYRQRNGDWERKVVDDSPGEGHTILTAALNRTGDDFVIAGFRTKPYRVVIYSPPDWKPTLLDDGGMAASACAAADLNGDGRTDIACIGSATANLKWYENTGAR